MNLLFMCLVTLYIRTYIYDVQSHNF